MEAKGEHVSETPEMQNPTIQKFDLQAGKIFQVRDFATDTHMMVFGHAGNEQRTLKVGPNSVYMYVHKGQAFVNGHFVMIEGMYAVIRDSVVEFAIASQVFLVEVALFSTGFMLGGPLKNAPMFGMPNGIIWDMLLPPSCEPMPAMLYQEFPSNFEGYDSRPNPHTVVGLVVGGTGAVLTPWGDVDLHAGDVFYLNGYDDQAFIAPTGTHTFRSDDKLSIVFVHPYFHPYIEPEELDLIGTIL